jgi:hypothetical protein
MKRSQSVFFAGALSLSLGYLASKQGANMRILMFSAMALIGYASPSFGCTCRDLGVQYACRAGANVYTCSDGGQISCHEDCGYPGFIPEARQSLVHEAGAYYGADAYSPRGCLTAERPIFWCVSDTEIRGCTRRSPAGGNNAECFGGRSAQFEICNSASGTQDFTGCRLF